MKYKLIDYECNYGRYQNGYNNNGQFHIKPYAVIVGIIMVVCK